MAPKLVRREYKPMLLINDSQAKLLELQGVCNECMRAHNDACAAICQAGIHRPSLLGLGRACEDGNPGPLVQGHGPYQLLKLHHVLLCQHLQAREKLLSHSDTMARMVAQQNHLDDSCTLTPC